MSDSYKVKINEEDEADESGETRVGRFEYGEWEQPNPERESRIADPHDWWLKEFISRGEGIGEYEQKIIGQLHSSLCKQGCTS